MQINSTSPPVEPREISYHIDDAGLDFDEVKNQVKKRVAETHGTPMILSWKNGITGRFYPTFSCGGESNDLPPWIYYARTRGANLTVNVNDGDYMFMILIV